MMIGPLIPLAVAAATALPAPAVQRSVSLEMANALAYENSHRVAP